MNKEEIIKEYNTRIEDIKKKYKRLNVIEDIKDLTKYELTDLSDRTEWDLMMIFSTLKFEMKLISELLEELQNCDEVERQHTLCERLDSQFSNSEKVIVSINNIINRNPSLKKYYEDYWNKENRVNREDFIKEYIDKLENHVNSFVELREECVKLNFCAKTKDGKYDFGPNTHLADKLIYLHDDVNELNDAISELEKRKEQDFHKYDREISKLRIKNANCIMQIKHIKKLLKEIVERLNNEQRK